MPARSRRLLRLVDYSVFKQFKQAADLPRNLRKIAGKPTQALVRGPRGQLATSVTEVPYVPLGDAVRAPGAPPSDAVADRLLRLSIRSRLPGTPNWTPRTDVTLYWHADGTLRLAAIERDA